MTGIRFKDPPDKRLKLLYSNYYDGTFRYVLMQQLTADKQYTLKTLKPLLYHLKYLRNVMTRCKILLFKAGWIK